MMENSKSDILLKCISMEKLQASAVSLKIVFRAREAVFSTAGNVVSLCLVAKYDGFLMLTVLKCGILTLLFVALIVAKQRQRHVCK